MSDNFYWLRAKGVEDYKALQSLPMTKLKSTCKIETRGTEKLARVKVTNPTQQIAFFVQLALTDGAGGAEIMPILWDDNYFSLLPGESREITARFAAKDAGHSSTALEVGGWNVETVYECASLTASRKEVKAGEPFTVTASIANTFLDGSRVTLLVDGRPTATKWAWARSGRTDEVAFEASFSDARRAHFVAVGDRSIKVKVNP